MTGQILCNEADPGYYVDTSASIIQTECAKGTYSSNYGASDASDCIKKDVEKNSLIIIAPILVVISIILLVGTKTGIVRRSDEEDEEE